MKKPVIIGFVGRHNSGKTTFIEKLIKLLKEEGYKVISIKHDPKGKAEIDKEGKDSYRMFQAGADQVILVSPDKVFSTVRDTEENPLKIIEKYAIDNPDIIILEGFKWFKGFDKYEVIRKEENRDLVLQNNPELKGVISDYNVNFSPQFDINNPSEFVKYLKEYYKI